MLNKLQAKTNYVVEVTAHGTAFLGYCMITVENDYFVAYDLHTGAELYETKQAKRMCDFCIRYMEGINDNLVVDAEPHEYDLLLD